MSVDPQLRARDADRARAVDELDAAYVDGQIDAAERESRVAAAADARTLGDLQRLVDDLQGDSPAPSRSADTSPWLWRVGAVAATLVLIVVGWRVIGGGDGSDDAPDVTAGSVAQAESIETSEHGVLWSEVKQDLAKGSASEQTIQAPRIGRWDASMSDISTLISAYRKHNGDYISGASFYREYGSIEQPLTGPTPGQQTWSFYADDPVFRSSAATTIQARDMTLLDLNELDLDRLGANVEHALSDLGVEDAQLLYISIDVSSDSPDLSVYVRNNYGETAYLHTTPSGEITQETEFSGA